MVFLGAVNDAHKFVSACNLDVQSISFFVAKGLPSCYIQVTWRLLTLAKVVIAFATRLPETFARMLELLPLGYYPITNRLHHVIFATYHSTFDIRHAKRPFARIRHLR